MTAPFLIGSLIVVLAAPGDPPPSRTCALLTPAEVEAVVSGKLEAPHPDQYEVPGTKETVETCTWFTKSPRVQVVISAAKLPPGTSATAVAKSNAGIDALRAQHWNEESKDFGGAYCSVMTPPAGKDGLRMSSCTAGPKGTLLSVVVMDPQKKPSIEQTKSLLDKAAARLP